MSFFYTKKVKAEWERKVEESYNNGKSDALDSINKSLNLEEYENFSEKELLIEIMKNIKIHDLKLEHLNEKIDFILNHKNIFIELDEKIKHLKKSEQLFSDNIEKAQKQVDVLKENSDLIINKAEAISNTLGRVVELKSKIEGLIIDYEKMIPNIEKALNQINEISSNMNETIEKYSDSPMTILNDLKDNTERIEDLFNEVKSDVNNLNEIVNIALNEEEYESVYYKLEEIKTEVNNSKYNYNEEEIKTTLEEIKSRIDDALDEYGYNSLYRKLEELKENTDN